MRDQLPQSVSNFLVPATGATNCVVFSDTLVAGTPKYFDFAAYQISGVPFRPSGVLIANTSANPVTVTIPQVGYSMTCAAGQILNLPYPAPLNHTAQISGNGSVTVVFVDYPVVPYSSAAQATITGTISVDGVALASDGVYLPLDDLAQTLAYNADGTLNYVQVTYNGNNYRQTLTYTSGQVAGITNWVRQ